MKTRTLLPAAVATCAAAYIVHVPVALAWVTTGWSLSTSQRDVRVFNNFTDPEANDNQTPDPNFPGWLGADLAIWKAIVEWGSELHGSGNGDPSQPAGLGSGGANFDATFQGAANKAGHVGDNTHSELAGCSGGTLAFTESFLNGNGWRTYYYQCWVWHDGPEQNWPPATGHYDLQGIATHEYGHALGLGHSSDPTATMYATPTDGKGWRSLERDDIAGVQAIYGVRDADKPRISGVSLNGATLVIAGSHFADAGNEVWFTNRSNTGNGDPVKATGVSSTVNGSLAELTVPAAAGSGDVLLYTTLGDGEALSNAWPIDMNFEGCSPTLNYCQANPNSTGQPSRMGSSGSQSVAANSFMLYSLGSPAETFGLFFYSATTGQLPVGEGTVCLGGPFYRLPAVAVDPQGRAFLALDLTQPPKPGGQVEPGSTWHFQWWYRDIAGGPSGFNFSDALRVPFCD